MHEQPADEPDDQGKHGDRKKCHRLGASKVGMKEGLTVADKESHGLGYSPLGTSPKSMWME